MKRYLNYFFYAWRHKWYVLLACHQLHFSGWLWAGLTHDLSKFSRHEFGPYARLFFNSNGTQRKVRAADGTVDPNSQSTELRLAWVHHQRNKHHWQAWVSIGECGKLSPLRIPMRYVWEMVADWVGAGYAIHGRNECPDWYEKNKDKMLFCPETRKRVEWTIKLVIKIEELKACT